MAGIYSPFVCAGALYPTEKRSPGNADSASKTGFYIPADNSEALPQTKLFRDIEANRMLVLGLIDVTALPLFNGRDHKEHGLEKREGA